MFARYDKMAKAFTRIGKDIVMAVKAGGADPANNPRLRQGIANARGVNMPKDRVESAIKRASDKDNSTYEEVVYEGYGPYGVAILVETATDNTTRTVANIRLYFNRGGGALGTSGSLSFVFDRKGVFRIAKDQVANPEELELELIDAGLHAMEQDENEVILYTAFTDFGNMQKALEDRSITPLSAEVEWIPTVTVPVSEDRFFHAEFQFKFENFARLSGPYDMWHLDYVYLNSGRVAGERSMPDRTISMNLTSIFDGYHAIPISHYRDTADELTVIPTIKLFGLLENNFQPFRYTTTADVKTLKAETIESKRIIIEDDAAPVNPVSGNTEIILPFQILNLTLQKQFPNDSIDLTADSVSIKMNFGLNTGDDNPLIYLPSYEPINFLRNDSTNRTFTLSSYYAKDDGVAEFGAGLNQSGAELAVSFDLLKSDPDTLAAIDIYFPKFGDQNNRTLMLKVWNHNDSVPGGTLTQQTITVNRSASNMFHRYQLSEPVLITGKFYVGWKQTSAIMVPAGLDKNSDSGKSIFFNITGSWEQDSTFQGSLMIRPVFGKGNGTAITTGLLNKPETHVWPNPTSDQFSISSSAQIIDLVDLSGRPIAYQIFLSGNQQIITLQNATPGIYILRWMEKNNIYTTKVIARMH